ncbi:MAG: glycosyltransferase family 4 protein [Caldilineaceae bacterium]|nr:glycosyltransferase family 4 protein [Caldilineaceae bacterium]
MLIGVDASRALRARRTGTERYAYELLDHLLRLPAATALRWRLYTDAAPPAELWRLPHVEWCVLPARRLWTHRTLGREVLRRPPDVLFVPSHVVPWRRPPRRLPPTVVTIHDLGYTLFPEAHPRGQRLYLRWSTRWSAQAATRVIAISQATARDLVRDTGIDPAKLRVIYEAPAPLPNPSADAIAAARARYGLARPYALYVGTLQPRKNLARLIDAYARLRATHAVSWDLVLAGGAGRLSAPILQQAQASPWAVSIHLPGYVQDTDLPGLMAGAHLFCFPSLHEGFGLPVLEAQALGVPVMTANNSALPEIAGDAALLVDPTDVEAMAAAMLRLSQDDALRARLIAAGFANMQRFSWEKAAVETLAVLQEAAAVRK